VKQRKKIVLVGILMMCLLIVFGCGGQSSGQKRLKEEQQAAQAEAELSPSMAALPTADAEGEDFPDVPRPPKSFRISSDITVKGGEKFGTVEYVSTAEISELTSFYESELKKGGWEGKEKLEKSMKGLPGALLRFEKGEVRCDVDIEKGITEQKENFNRLVIKHFAKL
jgi:hypothetical protein